MDHDIHKLTDGSHYGNFISVYSTCSFLLFGFIPSLRCLFFFFNKLTVFDVQLFFSLETMALFLGNHVADIIHFPLE